MNESRGGSGGGGTSEVQATSTVVVMQPVTVRLPKEVESRIAAVSGVKDGEGGGAADGAGWPTGPNSPDKHAVTKHSVTIGKKAIHYTATAGYLTLREEDGKAKAKVFFTAYTRDGVEDVASRPITFCFNGGPGSSSVWLHLGVLGPRRVLMHDDGKKPPVTPPPPYRLVENDQTILDVTDLVFIDPVSTGYSRAVTGEEAKPYHGVTEDVKSVGEFIRLYTTKFRRWGSPKLLAGESYGTTRAAGLSGYLQDRHGMYFNGLLLVSCALNFQTLHFDTGNDLPYMLFLPTYAAIAWYHKKAAADLLKRPVANIVREATEYAFGEYASAMVQGDRLAAAERKKAIERLAKYTGLSKEFIDRCEMRLKWDQFVDELLRDERRSVGRLDGRFKGIEEYGRKQAWLRDPSYSAIQGPYTAMLNRYVREDLGVENDLPYEIITDRVHPWEFDEAKNRYLDVGETLRGAMSINPALKVFMANGYYDLATPVAATEYTVSHLGLDKALAGNIRMGYYEAGHMMYVHEPSLARFKADVAKFVADAV